ncbi:Lrp/AsnC family transcriptional regulator, partial [Paracoccaceae bacterium]|nr:Lrp/AsnC family transcriptional regulator [Paracoccaceae bacterium]
MTTKSLDYIDKSILRALQKDASLSQRDLAEKVGLSQNSCWRRLTRLRSSGVIKGQTVRLDMQAIGMDLTVFALVRTRHHSAEWLSAFRKSVLAIENVIDFFRIAGDHDYRIKIVASDMADFDSVYQDLIKKTELETV